MRKDEEELREYYDYLLNIHSKQLEFWKKTLESPFIKPITKQLLIEAIKNKEDILKNLQNGRNSRKETGK